MVQSIIDIILEDIERLARCGDYAKALQATTVVYELKRLQDCRG